MPRRRVNILSISIINKPSSVESKLCQQVLSQTQETSLSREVFVLTAIDLNMSLPDADATNNETLVRGSLSTTNRASVGTIAQTNVFGAGRNVIVSDVALGMPVGIFSDSSTESPHAQLDYIGIIATNDFFAQIAGVGNTRVKAMDYRVWGYRAIASADTFAALTQSELLSA